MSLDYGRAFAGMRAQAGDAWRAYTRHAFVAGLSDGSLPREAFLHYLRQDYVFLVHFSRAWALAVVKSETHAEMLAAVGTVNALVAEEMQLHVELCAQAGIPAEQLFATAERPENLAYTRFVLEAGYSGDLLDLLAALAPCVMGYGEIGARLHAEATSQLYADWIAPTRARITSKAALPSARCSTARSFAGWGRNSTHRRDGSGCAGPSAPPPSSRSSSGKWA